MLALKQTILNYEVISQWMADLLKSPPGFPKFTMAYEIIDLYNEDEHLGFAADPSAWLVGRRMIQNGEKEFLHAIDTRMGTKRTHYLVSEYTGIPLADAYDLLNPHALYELDFADETITAAQFVEVLKNYIQTGVVDWTVILDTPAQEPQQMDFTEILNALQTT